MSRLSQGKCSLDFHVHLWSNSGFCSNFLNYTCNSIQRQPTWNRNINWAIRVLWPQGSYEMQYHVCLLGLKESQATNENTNSLWQRERNAARTLMQNITFTVSHKRRAKIFPLLETFFNGSVQLMLSAVILC